MIISKSKDRFKKLDEIFSKNLSISNIKGKLNLILEEYSYEEVSDYLSIKLNGDKNYSILYISAFFLLPENVLLNKIHLIVENIDLNTFHNLLINTKHIDMDRILLSFLREKLVKKHNISEVFDAITSHFRDMPDYFVNSFSQLKNFYRTKSISELQCEFVYLYTEYANVDSVNYEMLDTILRYIQKQNLDKIRKATLETVFKQSSSREFYKDSYLLSVEFRFLAKVADKSDFLAKMVDVLNDTKVDIKTKLLLFQRFEDYILTEELIHHLDVDRIVELVQSLYGLSDKRNILNKLEQLGIKIPQIKKQIIQDSVNKMNLYSKLDRIDSSEFEYIFEEILLYPEEYKVEVETIISILKEKYKEFIYDTLVRLNYQKKEVKGYSDYKYKLIAFLMRYFMLLYPINHTCKEFIQDILSKTKNNILVNAMSENYVYEDSQLEEIASEQIKRYLPQYNDYKTKIIGLSSFLSIRTNETLINDLLKIDDNVLRNKLNITIMRSLTN